MSTDSSNTAENSKVPGKPFQKGDPRINRKGRPKSFDELRKLAVSVAHEPLIDKDGKPVIFPGRDKPISKAESILLQWAQSGDPRKQALFIEYAYGKVPQKSDIDLNVKEVPKLEVILNTEKKN